MGAVQRPRAPLLEAAFVAQAPRGLAASLQMPFSKGPRALLCLEGDNGGRKGRALSQVGLSNVSR